MARAKGFTKAEKISACIAYQNGNGSLRSIAYEMGCSMSTFKRWYLRYAEHGESAFDEINSHGRYSLEYKREVIDYYLMSSESMEIVSAKYNMPYSTLKQWIKIDSNGKEYRENKPKGDTITMKPRETTFDERLEIIKWIISNSMNYKTAAEKYAISYSALYGWTKRYLKEGESALRYKRRGHRAKVDISNLSEVELLKHRLQEETLKRKRAELELQILKKKEEFEKKLRYPK